MAEIEGDYMTEQRSSDAAVHSFCNRMIYDPTQANQELQALVQRQGVQRQNKTEELTQRKIDQIQLQIQDHEKDVQKAKQHARQTQDIVVRQRAEKLASMRETHLELARQTLEKLQEQQPRRAY